MEPPTSFPLPRHIPNLPPSPPQRPIRKHVPRDQASDASLTGWHSPPASLHKGPTEFTCQQHHRHYFRANHASFQKEDLLPRTLHGGAWAEPGPQHVLTWRRCLHNSPWGGNPQGECQRIKKMSQHWAGKEWEAEVIVYFLSYISSFCPVISFLY